MGTWQRCEAHLILQTEKEIYNNWILGTREINRSDAIKAFFSPSWTVRDSVGKVLLPHRSLRNIAPTWVPVTTRASNIALFCLELTSCLVRYALYKVIHLEMGYLGEVYLVDKPEIWQYTLKCPYELGLSESKLPNVKSLRLNRALFLHLHLSTLLPICDSTFIQP